MNAIARIVAALIVCLLIAGCSQQETIKVEHGRDVPAEFERLADLLPLEESAGCNEAFHTFVAIIAEESNGDESLYHEKILGRFNGKSVQSIIDEYHRLDPAIVAKHSKAVSAKIEKARAEEWERIDKRLNDELMAELDAAEKSVDRMLKSSKSK
jgi:hypothetical protein